VQANMISDKDEEKKEPVAEPATEAKPEETK
jgi:hypothetical protein